MATYTVSQQKAIKDATSGLAYKQLSPEAQQYRQTGSFGATPATSPTLFQAPQPTTQPKPTTLFQAPTGQPNYQGFVSNQDPRTQPGYVAPTLFSGGTTTPTQNTAFTKPYSPSDTSWAPQDIQSQLKPGETLSPFILQSYPPQYVVLDASGNKVRTIRGAKGQGVLKADQQNTGQTGR